MSKRGDSFRNVPTTLWDRADIIALAEQPRALLVYLHILQGPPINRIPGLVRAGEASLAEGLRWDVQTFRAAFKELESRAMAEADWTAPLVWLHGELHEFNLPDNPKDAIGWCNTFRRLPDCALKEKAGRAIGDFLILHGFTWDPAAVPPSRRKSHDTVSRQSPYGTDTVSRPYRDGTASVVSSQYSVVSSQEPVAKPNGTPPPPIDETDAQFMERIKGKYPRLNIEDEAKHCRAWCVKNDKTFTRHMLLTWLDKAEPPLEVQKQRGGFRGI